MVSPFGLVGVRFLGLGSMEGRVGLIFRCIVFHDGCLFLFSLRFDLGSLYHGSIMCCLSFFLFLSLGLVSLSFVVILVGYLPCL